MSQASAGLWQIWKIFDPRRALIALFAFLGVLGLLIHFILLSTANFNWLDTAYATPVISRPAVKAVPVVAAPAVVKVAPVVAKPAAPVVVAPAPAK
jgi:light-harvesting complex 1 alpha chain